MSTSYSTTTRYCEHGLDVDLCVTCRPRNPHLPPTFDTGKPWSHATDRAKLDYIINMLEELLSRR